MSAPASPRVAAAGGVNIVAGLRRRQFPPGCAAPRLRPEAGQKTRAPRATPRRAAVLYCNRDHEPPPPSSVPRCREMASAKQCSGCAGLPTRRRRRRPGNGDRRPAFSTGCAGLLTRCRRRRRRNAGRSPSILPARHRPAPPHPRRTRPRLRHAHRRGDGRPFPRHRLRRSHRRRTGAGGRHPVDRLHVPGRGRAEGLRSRRHDRRAPARRRRRRRRRGPGHGPPRSQRRRPALLFLDPVEGVYRTVELSLGMFFEVQAGGRTLLVRESSDQWEPAAPGDAEAEARARARLPRYAEPFPALDRRPGRRRRAAGRLLRGRPGGAGGDRFALHADPGRRALRASGQPAPLARVRQGRERGLRGRGRRSAGRAGRRPGPDSRRHAGLERRPQEPDPPGPQRHVRRRVHLRAGRRERDRVRGSAGRDTGLFRPGQGRRHPRGDHRVRPVRPPDSAARDSRLAAGAGLRVARGEHGDAGRLPPLAGPVRGPAPEPHGDHDPRAGSRPGHRPFLRTRRTLQRPGQRGDHARERPRRRPGRGAQPRRPERGARPLPADRPRGSGGAGRAPPT